MADEHEGEPRFGYMFLTFTHNAFTAEQIELIVKTMGHQGSLVVDVNGPLPKGTPEFEGALAAVVEELLKSKNAGRGTLGQKDH